MGEAKDRGNHAARLAAALEREERRRAEWADEMVADAVALLDAARRTVTASIEPGGVWTDQHAATALTIAQLAATRATATDLVDALSDPADDVDDEPEPPAAIERAQKKAGTPLSLVTPKINPTLDAPKTP